MIRGWETRGFLWSCFEGKCLRKCGEEQDKALTAPTELDGDFTITVYDFDEPKYELEYPDKPLLRLVHADMLSVAKVELACLKYWSAVPAMPKAKDWKRTVDKTVRLATHIKVSESSSAAGELMVHVEKHCRDGTKSKEPKERGAWISDDGHVFTVEGLMSYLDGKRFRSLERREVMYCLLKRGAKEDVARIGARTLETLSLPLYEVLSTPHRLGQQRRLCDVL